MTVDVATPHDTRTTRARRAFRRWRKSRPFWGGLLLIAAGIEIFYSGNLNLGNIQIHLGLNGFKSYIIPLVVVLCGALIWATPMQRMFYGIIGTASAVYSVVSVNLGGFIVGLLLGIFGGALSIAWVPDKRPVDQGVDHGEPDDEDATTELGAELPAYVAEDHDHWPEPDTESSEELEGEQREPFRQPQAALDDETQPVIPAARAASDAEPATPAASNGVSDEVDPAVFSDTTAPMSRVRGIPDVPHVRGLADAVDSNSPVSADRAGDRGDEDTDGRGDGGGHGRGDGHGSPRALTITVIALTIGAMTAFAVRNAGPAAADTCTPTPMQSAVQQAIDKSDGQGPAGTKTGPTAVKTAKTASTGTSRTSTGTSKTSAATSKTSAGTYAGTATSASKGSSASASKSYGTAAPAPTASSQPHPIASLLGGALGILGLGSPTADATSATPDPNPSAEPSPSASQLPTTTPTTTPKPTPTVTAKPRPTPTRAATSRPTASHAPVPTPSTSSTPPPCTNTPKALARAAGQPLVGETPATQKAALLTVSGLSYDGNVSLPTANGSLEAMQFSMSSTTSTPFELDVPVGSRQCTIKSSALTLTGNVKIFAAELKGNLLGTVPVDFTPASPPPLPPLVTTDLFFTDATLTLVFVQTDTLTGDKFTITSD